MSERASEPTTPRRADLTVAVDVDAPAEDLWAAVTDWPGQDEWMLGTKWNLNGPTS